MAQISGAESPEWSRHDGAAEFGIRRLAAAAVYSELARLAAEGADGETLGRVRRARHHALSDLLGRSLDEAQALAEALA